MEIFTGGNHRTDWFSTYPFGHLHNNIFTSFDGKGHPGSKGSVIIGNDVYIGSGVTIMSGVEIGDGAVIGAKSVVVKNVESYSVVCGNPAILMKKRFSDDVVKRLLERLNGGSGKMKK